MEFLHISDLHYRKRYPDVTDGYQSIFREMTSPLVHLKNGLKKIDLDRLMFVLISGDLTEHGELEDYQELKTHLDGLFGTVPYIVTAGNHDNQQALYQVWDHDLGVKNKIGSITHFDNVTVIALNNASKENQNGIISAEHCEWLEDCLREESGNGNRKILMMHHPIVKDGVSRMPLVNHNATFVQILGKYPPTAILCGHTHNLFQGSYKNIFYSTAGSMSFKAFLQKEGTVCFREYASMNLCNLEGQRMRVREISIATKGKVLGIVNMEDG